MYIPDMTQQVTLLRSEIVAAVTREARVFPTLVLQVTKHVTLPAVELPTLRTSLCVRAFPTSMLREN